MIVFIESCIGNTEHLRAFVRKTQGQKEQSRCFVTLYSVSKGNKLSKADREGDSLPMLLRFPQDSVDVHVCGQFLCILAQVSIDFCIC